MKEYKFYGWQTAVCKPADPTYEKIQNPRHLYDILSEIWCEYTCAPRLREKWFRETHWQKTEKHERYNYLKAELFKKLEEL